MAASPSRANPVRKWREQEELNRNDAATVLEVSPSYLAQVENGYAVRLSPRFVENLTRLGADGITIAGDYVKWRRRRARALRRTAGRST